MPFRRAQAECTIGRLLLGLLLARMAAASLQDVHCKIRKDVAVSAQRVPMRPLAGHFKPEKEEQEETSLLQHSAQMSRHSARAVPAGLEGRAIVLPKANPDNVFSSMQQRMNGREGGRVGRAESVGMEETQMQMVSRSNGAVKSGTEAWASGDGLRSVAGLKEIASLSGDVTISLAAGPLQKSQLGIAVVDTSKHELSKEQFDEIKSDIEKYAEAQIEPEIKDLKNTIQRLAIQSTDRYTQVLQDLSRLSSDRDDVSTGWSTQDQGKYSKSATLTQEQSTGHGCRSPPCSRDMESCKYNDNCCADRMFEMLSDFSDFLNARNVTHFVVAGTLLGAVRDKDIIPSTADLDVVIPRDGWNRAKEINYIKGRKRSYYFMQDPAEHHCGRLCAVWEGLPVNHDSFTKSFEWQTDELGADIQYYMDIYDEGMDFAKSLAHLQYPLSNVTIRNRTFPAPHEQELWVEARYGPTWRTPDNALHGSDGAYRKLDEAKRWSESVLTARAAAAKKQ